MLPSFQRVLESLFLLFRQGRSGIPAFAGMTATIAVTFVLLSFPADAQTFPKLTGRVVDTANLLSPEQEATLTSQLAALEARNRRQLVVVTVPDLQGYAIEDYEYRLGRSWGIGEKDVNSGALLLVAPKERKVRIEVGYGLEPIVTDALSSVIIQTKILPAFRNGDMPGGILGGADALVELLSLPDEQAEARAKRIVSDASAQNDGGVPVALVFWGIVFAVILIQMIRNRGAGRAFRRGGLPVVLWGPGLGGGGRSGWGGGGFSSGGGGFSGGGGSFGGGGSSGSW